MNTPADCHTHSLPGQRHDLSMTIDQWTEEEDNEMDEWMENNELCEDCGESDIGYCACLVAEENASILGITTGEWLAERRAEGARLDQERAHRQNVRMARKRIIVWQRIVCVHRLITFWRKAAVAPDSKAFQCAAKRFKSMQ